MAREVVREPGVGPEEEVRARFGGVDVPSVLVGVLSAVAMVLLLSGIVAAVASTNIDINTALTNINEATTSAAIISLLILVVSFLTGGWAAGRMARYDGGLNGALVGVFAIVLAIVLAAVTGWVGTQYDLLPNIDLTQYVRNTSQLTGMAVAGALLALAAIIVSSLVGGMAGAHYHDEADATLLGMRGDRFGMRRRERVVASSSTPVVQDEPVVEDRPVIRDLDE